MPKPTKPKALEPIAPKAAKSPTTPLVLLVFGMTVTTIALALSGLLNSFPASAANFFNVIFTILFIIDAWFVVIGGIWLLVLAVRKWAHQRLHFDSVSPIKKLDFGLTWAVSILLSFYGIGSFFIYSAGQALLNALLFGLAIAMIVFVVRN